MPQHLTRLPLSLPMLVKKEQGKAKQEDNTRQHNTTTLTELTDMFNTLNTQETDRVFSLFIPIYLL